jgi:hypothetical protein
MTLILFLILMRGAEKKKSVHTYFRVYTNNVRFHVLINDCSNTRLCRITKPVAYFSGNSAAATSMALQSKSSLRLLSLLRSGFCTYGYSLKSPCVKQCDGILSHSIFPSFSGVSFSSFGVPIINTVLT